MPVITVTTESLAATERLGIFLAKILRAGDVVALTGPLGAGKSALARAIIAHHNPDEFDIPSPTFTLVQSYEMADATPLLHFDMYRLANPEEALELGIEDAFYDGVSLVEWPQKIGPLLPATALKIDIEMMDAHASDDKGVFARRFNIAADDAWQERLAGLAQL